MFHLAPFVVPLQGTGTSWTHDTVGVAHGYVVMPLRGIVSIGKHFGEFIVHRSLDQLPAENEKDNIC